jgi:hypothetical protein
MLAEIAAANAAFGILRQAVSNSQDLANFGKAISAVVVGEEALKKKSERESKSIWSKIAGKDAQDMDSFMELEKLRENKKQLDPDCMQIGLNSVQKLASLSVWLRWSARKL